MGWDQTFIEIFRGPDNVCREITSWHQRGIAFVWKDFHVVIGNISDSMYRGLYDVCWAAEVTVNKSSAVKPHGGWTSLKYQKTAAHSHFNCLTPRFLIWPWWNLKLHYIPYLAMRWQAQNRYKSLSNWGTTLESAPSINNELPTQIPFIHQRSHTPVLCIRLYSRARIQPCYPT